MLRRYDNKICTDVQSVQQQRWLLASLFALFAVINRRLLPSVPIEANASVGELRWFGNGAGALKSSASVWKRAMFVVFVIAGMMVMETVASATSTACNVVTEGLVACYPFDGNANDASGNGNHGTVHGATLTDDRFGKGDNAYSFDGQNDYIALPENLQLLQKDFSISAWIKPSNYGTISHTSSSCASSILSYRSRNHANGHSLNSGLSFRLARDVNCTGNKYLGINFIDKSFMYNGNMYNGNKIAYESYDWFLYSVTRKSDTMIIYVNGVEFGRSKVSDDSIYHNNNYTKTTIGAHFIEVSGVFFPFKGNMDDLSIYNRALTESEITQLYTGTATDCAHAQYIVEENVVRIPFLDIPLLDPLTQELSGEVAVARVDMSLIEGTEDFKVAPDTLEVMEVAQGRNECHAVYSYDGTLYIPNVDVQQVVILPPSIVAGSVVRTYEATLHQLPLNPDVFHLDSYSLK